MEYVGIYHLWTAAGLNRHIISRCFLGSSYQASCWCLMVGLLSKNRNPKRMTSSISQLWGQVGQVYRYLEKPTRGTISHRMVDTDIWVEVHPFFVQSNSKAVFGMCHSFRILQNHFTPVQCALSGSVCSFRPFFPPLFVSFCSLTFKPCTMPGLPTTPTSSASAAFTAMTSILFFQPSTWRVVQLDVLRNLVWKCLKNRKGTPPQRSKHMAIGGSELDSEIWCGDQKFRPAWPYTGEWHRTPGTN